MASFGQTAAILNIGLRVDTEQASRGLDRFSAKFKRTAADAQKTTAKVNSSLDLEPTLDDRQLKKDLRKAKADLALFSKLEPTAEAKVAIAGATAKVKELETRLAIFAAKDYNVDVNVDRDGGAQTALQSLWNWGRKLADFFGPSRGGFSLTSAFESAGSSMTGLGGSAGTSGAKLSAFASVASEAAAVVGVVLVAALAAATAAIVGLAASATAAVGAIAALGVAAGALAIPFAALSAGAMARFESDSETAGTSAFKLRGRLTELADAAVKSFGPGIDAVFRAVGDGAKRLEPLVKALGPAFTVFSKSVGRAINLVSKEFTNPQWTKFFTFLLNQASKVSGPLTKSFIILARIFARIAKASMPFLIQGLKALNQWLKGVGDKAPGVKQLSGIIGGLVDHLKSWWNLAKALLSIFAGIFTAALGPGKSLVDLLGKGAQKIADWVNSAEGQERIKQFFKDVMPLVSQLLTLFGQLVIIALQLGQALAPALSAFLPLINTVLKGIIVLLEWINKIPAGIRGWLTPTLAGPIVAGVVLIIGIVKQLWSWAQQLADKFKGAWDLIKKGAQAVGSFISGVFGKIKNAASDAIGWIKDKWGGIKDFLVHPFEAAVGAIRGFINDIISIINTVLGPVGVHIEPLGHGDTSTAGTGQQGRPHPGGKGTQQKARGGGIGGFGSGDKVPAMLEPGEFVVNRKAVQRIGMSKLQALNDATPRFQTGGPVQHLQFGGAAHGVAQQAAGAFTGGIGKALGMLPGTGDLPKWLKGAGDFVLDKVGGFIKKKLVTAVGSIGNILGFGGENLKSPGQRIIAVGHALQKQGFLVGENPAFGGVNAVHTAGSYHYQDSRAIDVNWPNAAQEPAHLRPLYDQLAKGTGLFHPTELFFQNRGIPGPVPNHYDHLHLAYQRGGGVPRPKHGAHWIKNLGGNVDVDEAATLLWQAGLSEGDAGQLARVIHTESGGNPRAHNPSGATGLFQILGSVFPGNLYDPRINAINAAIKWRDAGRSFGPWEGAPTGRAGRILRDRVQAEGGKAGKQPGGTGTAAAQPTQSLQKVPGFDTAKVKKAQKILATGKPKNQLKWAANYISAYQGAVNQRSMILLSNQLTEAAAEEGTQGITDRYGALYDQFVEQRGNINELIGAGNLEALQRYQVGASQNPVLGLAGPGAPQLTPLLFTTPNTMEALGLLQQANPSVGASTSMSASAGGGGYFGGTVRLPKKGRKQKHHQVIHNHLYIDGKELDIRTKKVTRRQARGGHRPLPSRGGG